ncbi:hypothetical protein M9H77_22335 [Catharanthus roseus]|uniref:Uncharacterized protein n=1 Tax=Catharanthus roseus TaxID=4058 RepID=A0ACC0APU4_CATRO|nr:hypothetical protein M9H77_22335 [Catharanthus roseus]
MRDREEGGRWGVRKSESTQVVLFPSQSINWRGFNREVLQEQTLGGAPQTKFYEARQKGEEEVAAMGAPIPNDLQLTATISSGLSCGRLSGAGLEVAHLKVENS